MTESTKSSQINHPTNPFTYAFVCDELAVSSIEYALLGSLIVAAIVTSVGIFGSRVVVLYELVCNAVKAAM